jgi:hypothetical protein
MAGGEEMDCGMGELRRALDVAMSKFFRAVSAAERHLGLVRIGSSPSVLTYHSI